MGDMRESTSIVITRGHIGQFASFIGMGALLIGLLGFIWQGGLTGYILAALGVGAAGIVLWAIFTPGEFVGFVTGRQARQGTVAIFSTFLLLGIVVMIYTFLERAVITADMTDGERYSLSPETREVLGRINRDIRITAFYSPRMVISQEIDDQIFRQYEVVSGGRVSRDYIDPIAQPAIAATFRATDGDVFISYVNEDGTVNMESVSYVPMIGRQERDMTQAISRLLAAGNFTVYYDLAHGQLDPADESARGISIATSLLRVNGFNVGLIDLKALAATGTPIPQDATAVVLARPQEQLTPDVINTLDAYLNRGGALFIMADVMFTDAPFLAEDSLFNDYLWENWGLRMLDAVVVDEGASGPTPLDVISAVIFDSAITANIDPEMDRDSRTQFRLARPIEVNDEPPVSNGRVIMSSPASYGETNLEALSQRNEYRFDPGEDIPGPLTTVAFAHDQNSDGKILLVGDSDFITNGQLRSPVGNALLFSDGIGWMTGFTEQVSFAPRAMAGEAPLIFVDTQTLDRIAFFTVIFVPGLMLVLGAGVWFYRSRR
jgi:hypothetical protein